MKKIISKIYCLSYVFLSSLVIAGCKGGGGGGGSSFLESVTGTGSGGPLGGGGSNLNIPESTASLATIHNPEPSTLLLFSSGLIGMAIYARAKLKGRGKK